MKHFNLFIISVVFILTSCTTHRSFDTENLNDLEHLTQQETRSSLPTVGAIRLQAIKETALTIGAQGGLAKRSKELNAMLEANDEKLSRIFNFNGLLLDKNVLPPVLEESSQSLSLSDPNTIRISDHSYKIIKQARFVTTPPIWRDYLWMEYHKPELPDTTLLPKSKQERKLWIKYVRTGWKNGIEQASNIYASNLAKLRTDYKGMMLYQKLLAQNMVSKPFVATTNLGVTSDPSNNLIRINDHVLRITATPKLKADSRKWQPVLVKKQDD